MGGALGLTAFRKYRGRIVMKNASLRDRLRYRFDNTMSRGPAGLIGWLALISLVLVVGVSLVVKYAGADSDKGMPEIVWNILFQTMTPNPVDTKAGSLVFLGGMLFVTFGSIFLVSIFIGILTNAIDIRIQSLRKGRSRVLEEDHTLIIGWSPQVFTIISELVEANASRKDACIVILADKDKIEMEDELQAQLPNTRTTRVVCRTGNPLDQAELRIVNPDDARSIVILAPDGEDADTQVIKTILAITNNPHRKKERYHIVAEIREERNVRVAQMVGRDEVQLVMMDDLISRISVQTCRQAGLSVVYTELLNFGGDEIYFKEEPALVGKTYGESLFTYDKSAVMGLHTKDGRTLVNPPMDTKIGAGDQVIVVSEDDTTVHLSGDTSYAIKDDAIALRDAASPAPERTLVLGWNRRGPHILTELDAYVAQGSETRVVASVAPPELPKTKHQNVTFTRGDTSDRDLLDGLDIASFNHIIILSYSDELETQRADAQTLVTLLHLRDMSEKSGKEFAIVSEMLDLRNRQLAEVTRADDFIVSDHLVSLMLAQVSENKHLNAVFDDLFDPEGSEIYLKPATNYVKMGEAMNFHTVVEAAKRKNETAIGFRLKRDAHDQGKAYGVAVNPSKRAEVTFTEGDKVIVLAES
jgi:ion channel POLLUX/CASTOR